MCDEHRLVNAEAIEFIGGVVNEYVECVNFRCSSKGKRKYSVDFRSFKRKSAKRIWTQLSTKDAKELWRFIVSNKSAIRDSNIFEVEYDEDLLLSEILVNFCGIQYSFSLNLYDETVYD